MLKEVPHWYLIPDPNLLPQRTIRTFQIDFKWIQSLWLGALSLGGRTQVSAELYEKLVTQLLPTSLMQDFLAFRFGLEYPKWWSMLNIY